VSASIAAPSERRAYELSAAERTGFKYGTSFSQSGLIFNRPISFSKWPIGSAGVISVGFPMSIENTEWHVLVVRPRSEKAVAEALANRGVERYLPVYGGRYRSEGQFQEVDLSLFPQYVFCRIGPWSRGHVLGTPGVFRFVAFGNKLAPVEAAKLDNVRLAVGSGAALQPWPFLQVGDYVEIPDAPLPRLVGPLLTAMGDCRLILDVAILQRSVAITINRNWVRPCPMPTAARNQFADGMFVGARLFPDPAPSPLPAPRHWALRTNVVSRIMTESRHAQDANCRASVWLALLDVVTANANVYFSGPPLGENSVESDSPPTAKSSICRRP